MTANDPEIGTTVVVDGVATNVHDRGEGQPVVLVHGSGPGVSAWANWRLALPVLADRGFRVVAPDLLGFGYTEPRPGATYDLETWRTHLLGLLDALGLEQVSLVGNSFGGAVALDLAVRHPDRVSRLVLMGSVGVAFPITPALDAVWGFDPARDDMADLLRLFAHDQDRVTADLAALRLRAAARPGVHESYSSMFPAPRQAAVDALCVPEELIAGITAPTLLVHGRDDRVIPPATSLRLHELIDDSHLHLLGRCGHWAQVEHASTFHRLLTDFLSPTTRTQAHRS